MFSEDPIAPRDLPRWVSRAVTREMTKRSGGSVSADGWKWIRETARVWRVEQKSPKEGFMVRAARVWRRLGNHTNNRVDRLRNHVYWSRLLSRRGVPTATIRLARFRNYGVFYDGLAVEDVVDGRNLHSSIAEDRLEVARLIARVHTLSLFGTEVPQGGTWLRPPSQSDRLDPHAWWRLGWQHWLHGCPLQFSRALAKNVPGILLEHIERVQRVVVEIDARMETILATSPHWVPIHSDLHRANIRFDSGGTLHLIDLEWMHYGLSGLDIAMSRRLCCNRHDERHWPEFRSAYEKAGGGDQMAESLTHMGTYLAIHDIRRASVLVRALRRGLRSESRFSPIEWLELAEQTLERLP